MEMQAGETTAEAIAREATILIQAFAGRMQDIRASRSEGIVILETMLKAILAMLVDGEVQLAQHLLDAVYRDVGEALPAQCRVSQAFLAEHRA